MPEPKTYYVTTPIYYVNDSPHIGHAYTTVAGDVLARWHRQRRESVWFLTGTDEHGTKVERAARDNGVAPQDWCDRLVETAWKPVLETVDAANDDFIRTTSDRHRAGVQKFWNAVKDAGHVYEGDFQGPYCVGCEEFKRSADLMDGPDGTQLCPIHHRPVETLSETNWFFRLSEFTEPLLAHYENNPGAVSPASARNEVLSFIKQGLDDISMSRSSVEWGVPLPWDDGQVIYVWFDALLNYITALGYGAAEGSLEARRFATTWPANVHLVGKDILRFHAVYWPAMLMAAGLPLPEMVFAHGWLLVSGEKMSKSKLTGIAPARIIDHFGSDSFRYYFLRAIQFGQDGSFSWEDMTTRHNSELANGLGNLASRAIAMVDRYRDGVVPEPANYSNVDLALQDLLLAAVENADAAMTRLEFSVALEECRAIVDAVNGYVTEQAPWVLSKSEEQTERADRLNTVLYVMCESLRALAVLYNSFMPKAMQLLWARIGARATLGELVEQSLLKAGHWGQLPPGSVVSKGDALFPRLAEVPE